MSLFELTSKQLNECVTSHIVGRIVEIEWRKCVLTELYEHIGELKDENFNAVSTVLHIYLTYDVVYNRLFKSLLHQF